MRMHLYHSVLMNIDAGYQESGLQKIKNKTRERMRTDVLGEEK